jgi:CRP-like cAMP-binding protein
MTLYNYLQQFQPISEEEFSLLMKGAKTKHYTKGDYIIVPGQAQKELLFVQKGIQMAFYEGAQKSHVVAFTYAPGLCAIPGSFTHQKPSGYYLQCLSDSKFECLPAENLTEAFNQSQNIERLFRKMTETILEGVIERHRQLQTLSIRERYLSFCQRSPHLLQMAPHKYIASYLGIDSTNFSKLFNSVKY